MEQQDYKIEKVGVAWLRKFKNKKCTMIHRVDGPLGIYRGADLKNDQSKKSRYGF